MILAASIIWTTFLFCIHLFLLCLQGFVLTLFLNVLASLDGSQGAPGRRRCRRHLALQGAVLSLEQGTAQFGVLWQAVAKKKDGENLKVIFTRAKE